MALARAALAVTVAAALLAGCAGPDAVRGRLHLGMEDAPEGRQLVWPPAPEVPRYLYAGTLVGEPNFRRDGEAAGGLLAQLGRAIAGLDDERNAPLVLQRPVAVCGDEAGRLYVTDASRQAVFVFDEAAGELRVWTEAAPGLRFVSPVGVAAVRDAGGGARVWVADAGLGSVFEFDGSGRPLRTFGKGRLQRPTGLARDAAGGRLFVADTGAHDIKVYADRDGSELQVIGGRGSEPGRFNYPTHLALAGGELYVTDTMNHRVQVLGAADGAPRRSIGQQGLYVGNLVRPKGVGVDADGNVYVIESYHDSLLVYTAQGELLLPIGGTGADTGRFYLPAGVWVDARNRVHVADMFNGRVVLFQFLGGG
ncbi:MAG: 6-bladed beta-propeller [Rubrivivax sp.]|nr:6-bladed beta-propeller [Rubrivivax sp.]